jgi:cell division protein ZapB
MISDFSQLSDKVNQLAELVISLRSENIALQNYAVSMAVDNADLTRRMQEARDRVAALMDRLPAEPEIEAKDVEESP